MVSVLLQRFVYPVSNTIRDAGRVSAFRNFLTFEPAGTGEGSPESWKKSRNAWA